MNRHAGQVLIPNSAITRALDGARDTVQLRDRIYGPDETITVEHVQLNTEWPPPPHMYEAIPTLETTRTGHTARVNDPRCTSSRTVRRIARGADESDLPGYGHWFILAISLSDSLFCQSTYP